MESGPPTEENPIPQNSLFHKDVIQAHTGTCIPKKNSSHKPPRQIHRAPTVSVFDHRKKAKRLSVQERRDQYKKMYRGHRRMNSWFLGKTSMKTTPSSDHSSDWDDLVSPSDDKADLEIKFKTAGQVEHLIMETTEVDKGPRQKKIKRKYLQTTGGRLQKTRRTFHHYDFFSSGEDASSESDELRARQQVKKKKWQQTRKRVVVKKKKTGEHTSSSSESDRHAGGDKRVRKW